MEGYVLVGTCTYIHNMHYRRTVKLKTLHGRHLHVVVKKTRSGQVTKSTINLSYIYFSRKAYYSSNVSVPSVKADIYIYKYIHIQELEMDGMIQRYKCNFYAP